VTASGAMKFGGFWSRPAVRWIALVVIAAGVLVAAFALPKAQTKAQPIATDDAAVVGADAALREAMRAADKGAARRLLALQFSFVDADGKSYARKDVLADLKRVAASAAGEPKVRNYGLLATVTGRRASASDAEAFFLDVWVKQKGAWRALLIQDVPMADAETTAATPQSADGPQSADCKNPCETLPYRVRSPAEQDVVNAFQALIKAIVAHDAGEWAKHVADEFALYASGRPPVSKADRIAAIERQKESDAAAAVGEVQSMRLAVYGDGAVMTTTDAVSGGSHPPYRAARVWVKRGGQWLLALSAHTDTK
jgi:Domain of unknown function (DUF4440)